MTRTPRRSPGSARRQTALIALGLIVVALTAGLLAQRWLTAGPGPDLGVLQLRLVYNPGVSFGLGANLPSWVITTVTGAVIAGLAVYAWYSAPTVTVAGRMGLAAVLAGAISNLIDRAIDGVVTDYFHTGWFPTFNLPDVFITLGAVLLVLQTLWSPTTNPTSDRPGGPDPD